MRISKSLFLLLTVSSLLSAQQLNKDLLEGWNWRLIGPSAPAGRAWTVVGVESDPKTLYVTTAGGGLWKSVNNGTTFIPVFNHETSASTGAVAIAKTNTNIVWVGTGEPACTRANSWGDGVYKSTNGGMTWQNMGLTESREISAIVIHPKNPDIVYVAAMGYLWGANSERGIFKTTDGGLSWSKSLFVNDTTGFNDLQMDPLNPELLFAGAWHRIRWGDGDMTESGQGSGIYKSINGGTTWERLSNGLPTDPMGKIHISIGRRFPKTTIDAQGKIHIGMGTRGPMIIYANILTGEPVAGGRTSKQGGLFRSEDAGISWVRVNERQTNYYYNRVYVDPSDENTVWMPVFELNKSIDGGKTFEKVNMRRVHNDLHSMWIDPNDPSHIVISGDGGVSISYDRCATWQQTVLPIGQFYEVSADNQDPYHVIGGMQDTGHWFGPSQTYDEEGITTHDWIKLRYNGDGMGSASDPRDPNIIYMVQEFGNTSRLDMKTWDRTELQPTDTAELRKKGATHPVRWDWTPAFALSIHNPDIVYLGSNYLFRINGKTGKYDIISPDLSRQQGRTMKGAVDGYHSYGALFSVAESPLDKNILWAGADDGPVWITRNGGKQWIQVDGNLPAGIPDWGVISEIEVSRFAKGTAYVAIDCHTREDIHPYLFKTTDFGKSWTNITSDLPEKGSSLVIRESPVNPNVLFVGTEFGVFVSVNGGKNWVNMNGNLPTAGVRTMVIQPQAKELIAGTFGRAIWVTDIAPFEEMNETTLDKAVHLFKTKTATKFKVRETFGNTIEELNGDMFFRAQNPPYGAAIKYFVKDALSSSVQVIVRNTKGEIVRRLTGQGSAGIQTIIWDLKKDSYSHADSMAFAREMTPGELEYLQQVSAGTYDVELTVGKITEKWTLVIKNEGIGVSVGSVRK